MHFISHASELEIKDLHNNLEFFFYLLKLKTSVILFRIDLRYSLDGKIPSLENIPKENDVLFVWTGTSTGMSVNNCDFIKDKQEYIPLLVPNLML